MAGSVDQLCELVHAHQHLYYQRKLYIQNVLLLIMHREKLQVK